MKFSVNFVRENSTGMDKVEVERDAADYRRI